MQRKIVGIWFYGLAGSGKTLASKYLMQKLAKGFLIDGDDVRKYISSDLNYTLSHRKTQLKRLLGISKLTLLNGYVPIVSSVTMNQEILDSCIDIGMSVAEIQRPEIERHKVREIYKTQSNVVGVDIKLDALTTTKIYNCGTKLFEQEILKYAYKAG